LKKNFPYLKWKYMLLTVPIFLLLIASASITGVNATSVAKISVKPPSVNIQAVGQNVTIEVNVTNVQLLYGWDIQLTYNSTLLTYVGYTVIGPNQVCPSQHPNYTLTDVSVAGTIIHGCAFSGAEGALPFNGSGVMEWITFKGTMKGVSNLSFIEDETFLWDPNGNAITRNPCANGQITVLPEFPTAIAMSLVLIATLAAASLGKIVRSRKFKDVHS
jgi:hypothetical protein